MFLFFAKFVLLRSMREYSKYLYFFGGDRFSMAMNVQRYLGSSKRQIPRVRVGPTLVLNLM
jgi:hypothetical protein